MQDFGGPVGYRIASRHPENVSFLIVQNAKPYEEGLRDSFWAPASSLWNDPSPDNFKRSAMPPYLTPHEWNYTHGVKDRMIAPESWVLQRALLIRPATRTSCSICSTTTAPTRAVCGVARYSRSHRPPTLIVWGRNDVIFPTAGGDGVSERPAQCRITFSRLGGFAHCEDHAGQIARSMRKTFSTSMALVDQAHAVADNIRLRQRSQMRVSPSTDAAQIRR